MDVMFGCVCVCVCAPWVGDHPSESFNARLVEGAGFSKAGGDNTKHVRDTSGQCDNMHVVRKHATPTGGDVRIRHSKQRSA